jgi:hypothetical protein
VSDFQSEAESSGITLEISYMSIPTVGTRDRAHVGRFGLGLVRNGEVRSFPSHFSHTYKGLSTIEVRLREDLMDLERVFNTCLAAIGGETNADIRWYWDQRPRRITRQAFFAESVWAIWVSGLRRTSAKSFLERAETCGFGWNFERLAAWDDWNLRSFMRRLHRPVRPTARRKWQAVYTIARWLDTYETDHAFRVSVFQGKEHNANLSEADVQAVAARKLPHIRQANAQLIVRNMGGEVLQCDRWMQAFLAYTGLSLQKLCTRLRRLAIPLGFFDLVVWAYCERCVGRVHRFRSHFERTFA